ncbi:MAG: hypothetical protein DYG98_11020 [Haliscomenobacteraceae bacterium CHB4]|nr:hypothetical protein [Saprospiraceae bacterium]MCE7923581.1 hypothetical protein [Haliscomenobacteraceae bacterium CHB4]
MKAIKIIVFVLLVLNMVAPIFQSCIKDTPKTDNQVPPTLEQLVNTYNTGVTLEHEKAILLEGDMTIMTLPSKEVLFFLKRGTQSSYDIFLGQGTELSSAVQKELGKVKVAYLREAMAVQTEDGNIYTFTIGERKGHEVIQKLSPAWTGKGYGLAYSYNGNLSPKDFKGLSSTNEIRASTCKCRRQEPNTDWSDCDSGGEGASSCSIGASGTDPGCSVSCASNSYSTYYACCQNG